MSDSTCAIIPCRAGRLVLGERESHVVIPAREARVPIQAELREYAIPRDQRARGIVATEAGK